jgi:hypothetical protein
MAKKALPIDDTDAVKKLTEEANEEITTSEETSPAEPAEAEDKTSEVEEKAETEAPEKVKKPAEEAEPAEPEPVPYHRFKEVNDSRKTIEKKLTDLQTAYQDLLERSSKEPPKVAPGDEFETMDARSYAAYVANLAKEEAKRAVTSEQEVQRQRAEAIGAYPELDRSNDRYNQEFEEAVVGIIYANRNANKSNPDNWLTAKQAADKVAKLGGYFKSRGEQEALEDVKSKSGAGGAPASGKAPKVSPEDMSLEELESTLPKSDRYFRPVATGKK